VTEQTEKVAEFIELRSRADRLPRVCALTAHHHEQGQTVSIYAPHPAMAEEVDDLLWVFRQNSFIPHVRLEKAGEPPIEPVIIFSNAPEGADSDVLIVADAAELPAWFERFAYIYDFAPAYDEALREAARQRYAALKAAGYRMRFARS
jgi:DNA polymerase-3 subunit chi